MRTGKEKEFIRLLKSVEIPLSNYARALSETREEALDLIQDSIEKSWKSFDKLKDKSAFKTYIFKIAHRTQKKKNWRKRHFAEYDEESMNEMIDNNVNIERNLEVEELYRAIQQIPREQAEAISLFELSGFSLAETAKIQKCSPNTVKTRLFRARNKLAELLEVPGKKKDNPIGEKYQPSVKENMK